MGSQKYLTVVTDRQTHHGKQAKQSRPPASVTVVVSIVPEERGGKGRKRRTVEFSNWGTKEGESREKRGDIEERG